MCEKGGEWVGGEWVGGGGDNGRGVGGTTQCHQEGYVCAIPSVSQNIISLKLNPEIWTQQK